MLEELFDKLIRRRHYWRYASFSEIAELYVSHVLRVIGVNIASGFASVYMYQLGYDLLTISYLWAGYFLLKILLMWPAAGYTAYFGPKHGILLSNILYIPAMMALGLAPEFGIGALIIWFASLAASTSIYALSYNTSFSKIRSFEHAGKELGFMNIFDKIAIGVSPVIGGFIALIFGPQTIMWVAAVVFLMSAFPLLRTSEPTRLRQKLDMKGFPWRVTIRALVSRIGLGFDYAASIYAWTLFIAIVIFADFGNEIYVTLGALSSITILVAVVISYAYGKLIDKNRGGELLKYSVILNSLVHLSRSFVATPAAVVTTNVVNEISTSGMQMSYMRGIFDTADLSGNRIIYLALSEAFGDVGVILGYLVLVICVALLGDADGLKVFFLLMGPATLIIGTAKFQLYRK